MLKHHAEHAVALMVLIDPFEKGIQVFDVVPPRLARLRNDMK